MNTLTALDSGAHSKIGAGRGKRRVRVLPRLGALALVLALAGAARAQSPEAPPAVVIAAAVSAELQAPTRALQGTVVAARSAQLSARLEGRVEWVAPLGSEVAKGGVVARLDDAQARLVLARERARLQRLTAERDLAQRQVARLQAMADAVPAAQRDEAQARAEVLAAQLAEARVAVQMAQLELDETTLEAPFAGSVAAELKQAGEQAAPGAPLLTLTDTAELELELAVPVELAAHAKPGDTIALEGSPALARAVLRALVPGPAEARQLRARLSLPGRSAAAVGAALTAAWPAATPAPALTVPMDALVRRNDGVHVMRIDGGVARRVPVEIGTRSGDRVAVVGQLGPGDQVIVRGGERLADGAKVQVSTPEALAAVVDPQRVGS